MTTGGILTAVLMTLGVGLLVGIQAWRERNEKKATRPIVAVLLAVGLVLAFAALFAILFLDAPYPWLNKGGGSV